MKDKGVIVKKKKKQSKGKKWFWNILFVICLGLFIYSAGNVIKDYYGSYKAGQNLSSLKKSVFKDDSANANEKNTTVKKVVNLEELKKLNSDSIGWLEVPDTNIDEPLVQGKDNDYYLWRDFDKKTYPVTGTLFLDMYNKPDFSDRISYIFGHNVWDKTKFYAFYIYTEKGKMEYEVLGVDLVDPNTPLYELTSKRNEDVNAMKKELTKHIPKEEVDKIDENTKLLMLVTCKTPNDNSARRILFAKLKEK